ncbi:MAG: hypothetical protein Kow00105_08520 [Phycisphaeraceae bacterium]
MPDSHSDTHPVSADQPAQTLKPGDKVDPYTIKRQIGSGGSSIVFKATDELLGKHVAIKQFLFHDQEDAQALRDKIMTEARLHQKAAQADPDRLVQVIDVVDSPYGLLLISEYIDGPSLEQILAQNPAPMDLKQALGIIAAVAQALEAIHGKGIVHLDLKPANILMPRAGGLKLSDFGLASDAIDHRQPTAGTFRYMAPELLKNEKVDGRADLYALGMIAYEMLAGRANFDQVFKAILKDQRNQAMRWIKWHTNPRAKATPLTELVPTIPQSVSAMVARLMEKDPAKRYSSAREVLDTIRDHFAGKSPTEQSTSATTTPASTPTTPTSGPGDTALLPSQGRRWMYLWIALIAVAVAAGGFGIYSYMQHRQAKQQAVEQTRQILDDANQAYQEGRFEEALSKFKQVSQDPTGRHVFGRHAEAGALLAQGQIARAEGRYDEALDAFQRAADMGEPYRDQARLLTEDTRQAKAFSETVARIEGYIDNQQFGEARKELDAWRDLAATDDERQTLRGLGARLEDQLARYRVHQLIDEAQRLARAGQRDEAIELLKTGPQRAEVTELLEKLEADRAAEQAVALAEAALRNHDPEEAIRQYELAVQAKPDDQALRDRLLDIRSDWLVEEGLRMLAEGNTVGADQLLTEALGYRPNNTRAREALARIASSSRRQAFIDAGDQAASRRDYATAEAQYRNALELGADEELQKKLTLVRVQRLLREARTAMEEGRIDQANELVNRARRLLPDSPDVAAVVQEVVIRGEYLRHLKAGDQARARSAFGEAKRHYLRAKEAMDTPQVRARLDETEFDHLIAQARDYLAAGEYASAKAQLQIAAGIRMTDEVRQLLEQVMEAGKTGSTPDNP